VGDLADPMTAERAAIFQPLGLELARQMEAATGSASDAVPPTHRRGRRSRKR
jgi:hypothetical protein